VVYAVMPDVFAPYWCVGVEPVGHECQWQVDLLSYCISMCRRVHSRHNR